MSEPISRTELVMRENQYLYNFHLIEECDRQLEDLLAQRLRARQQLCKLEQWFINNKLKMPK